MFLLSLVLKNSSPCATQKGFTSTASRVRKAKAGQQEKDLKNSAVLSFFGGFYMAASCCQLLRVLSLGREQPSSDCFGVLNPGTTSKCSSRSWPSQGCPLQAAGRQRDTLPLGSKAAENRRRKARGEK